MDTTILDDDEIRDFQSAKIDKLATAMVKVQSVLNAPKLDGKNPAYRGSNYASLHSTWESCREHLTQNGLVVIQTTRGHGKDVILCTRLVHESGQWISGEYPINPIGKIDSATKKPVGFITPQDIGSAISYARRYTLSAIVGISTDKDDDGNLASGVSENKSQSPKEVTKSGIELERESITFGKHKGCTFSDIKSDDLKSYKSYLSKQPNTQPFIREFITKAETVIASRMDSQVNMEQPPARLEEEIPF